MEISKSLLLIVSLSSLLICSKAIPLVSEQAAAPAVLVNLCKDAENPGLCVKTILPYLRRGPFNPFKALQAEISVTTRQAKKVLGIINRLIGTPNNSKSLADTLSVCKDNYESIMDSIKETLGTLAPNNMYESRVKFSAVISFQTSCEDTFKESSGLAFPFARDSNTLFQLAGNCLAIMQAMEH